MVIENEQDIISEIRNKFSDSPDAMEKIISMYQKNKNDDFTLDNKFLTKIPREAQLPNESILKSFDGLGGESNARRWGRHKLENIFLRYKNEQWSYFPDSKMWFSGSTDPNCASDDRHVTP